MEMARLLGLMGANTRVNGSRDNQAGMESTLEQTELLSKVHSKKAKQMDRVSYMTIVVTHMMEFGRLGCSMAMQR